MRMMGRESVEYHRATVLERGDDYPGRALAYYASRGETPLTWAGSGAVALGLSGPVSLKDYEAIYGPGGARHPDSGDRLVATQRPGMELVISAHKSVAELGVIGRAEHMHEIMDAERDATLAYLDRVAGKVGGRRGRAATVTPTAGLVYAHTRHATSRAGDPCPHDHVLLANVVEMLDQQGGWKAADTALWREHMHSATMIGRTAAARAAVDLGYGIEADPGPSGRLRQWRIAGVPEEVMKVHSKRAAEITAECQRRGQAGYRARSMAARTTRGAKESEGVEAELIERWQDELAALGWPVERLAASIDIAATNSDPIRPMGLTQARQVLAEVLGEDSELARRKLFFRRDAIVAVAPHLYGQDPRLVEALADRALADPETVPLLGVPGARERPYSLASVIAREVAIAECLARQTDRTDAPAVPAAGVERAITSVEATLDGSLSREQRQAVEAICGSGRGGELVVGVAGAGKTTMLAAVAAAFDAAGYLVVGTATSGQAARTLGVEAGIGQSRTLSSLIWRLEHDRLALDDRSVVVLDEAAMTDDIGLARLAAHVEAARAKLILVGDHRQLAAVGPGGALQALVNRHPAAVHRLVENRRQHHPHERQVLAQLRDGELRQAVAWYQQHDRVHACPDRDAAVQAIVDAWAADVAAGSEAAMYAWLRANVAELNQAAREWMEHSERLDGPELVCPGGLAYRAGDHVITLAPAPDGSLVTSQPGTVQTVDPAAGALVIRTDDGRNVTLTGDEASAERLNYSYATTVHRAQGATVARAHLFADGGGRELAYVAMSRARESTHIWAVADHLPQAVDDLRRDWQHRRSPTWAIDLTPPPAKTPTEQLDPNELDQRARHLALHAAKNYATAQAVTAVRAPDLTQAVAATQAQLRHALNARADLQHGAGIYQHSEAGRAVRDLAQAQTAHQQTAWDAQHAPRWRDRRAASKEQTLWAERHTDAQHRHQTHYQPEVARLERSIQTLRENLQKLQTQQQQYRQAETALADHKGLSHRNTIRLTRQVTTHRNHLDGQPRPAQTQPTPRTQLIHPPAPTPQPPTPPPPQLGMSFPRFDGRVDCGDQAAGATAFRFS
jgi:conjugative relaxase-like TrwC/TraI family protein